MKERHFLFLKTFFLLSNSKMYYLSFINKVFASMFSIFLTSSLQYNTKHSKIRYFVFSFLFLTFFLLILYQFFEIKT